MIREGLFHGFWLLVIATLITLSLKFQDRTRAMLAQVENDISAISYEYPVRIRAINVAPGQQVDSGDVLIEVDQPEILSEIRKLETERHALQVRKEFLTTQYFDQLNQIVQRTNRDIAQLQVQNSADGSGNATGQSDQASNTLIDRQIATLRTFSRQRNDQLRSAITQDTSLINAQIRSLTSSLEELDDQSSFSVGIAKFSGIVGSVNVRLDELVPAYTTILTLYESAPTMIKAFAQEQRVQRSLIGSAVTVRSTNRDYSVRGRITEVGKRVVPYPEMINTSVDGSRLYGQEIFIRINPDNRFLNGEMVHVFLTKAKAP